MTQARDDWFHVRQRVLNAAFSGASQVLLVGDQDATDELARSSPGLFVVAEDGRDEALRTTGTSEILALSLDPNLLARASDLWRRLGCTRLFLLLANLPSQGDPRVSCSALEEARQHLRKLGFVAIDFQRILWVTPGAAVDEKATSRTERINRETREVLIECCYGDDPATVFLLAERLARQRNQIDLLSDVQVQQARTRNAEKQRLARCSELEETVQAIEKVRSAHARALLVAESQEIEKLSQEIEKLRIELAQSRNEIEVMSSARVWRLGLKYWRIRSWLSGAFPGRER